MFQRRRKLLSGGGQNELLNAACCLGLVKYLKIFNFNSIYALAHNALQFSFFFFFFFSAGFWTDCLKLFSKRFLVNYQGNVWSRSNSFLGHTKKSFRKKCSWSCYLRRLWYMTRLKHGNQHSQHQKKHKKQPEARNMLASQWIAEDSRV